MNDEAAMDCMTNIEIMDLFAGKGCEWLRRWLHDAVNQAADCMTNIEVMGSIWSTEEDDELQGST